MTVTVTDNVVQHPAIHPLAHNIVAVASGKGGVGKTCLSISLSQALAQRNRRVLLFDGDLGLANVDIQLGLLPKHDIASVISGRASIDDAITRYTDGGFDIIAGRSGSGSLAAMPAMHLKTLKTSIVELAEHYDAVVLDLAAGVDEAVRSLASLAGAMLVVTTDEPTAITDAYAFIKVMNAQQRAHHAQILVNMASTKNEGKRTYETLRKACESFLRISPPLAGIVRRDNKVRDSIRRQIPVLTRYPTCSAGTDIAALAGVLDKAR